MTVLAEVVADRIRAALPSLSQAAVDNLVYLCQGHYVGRYWEPLFLAEFLTNPGGVALGPARFEDEYTVEPILSEAERAVVDDVVTRYGQLSADVLTDLVCATWPWQEAHSGGWLIAPEVIRDDFLRTLPDAPL